MPREPTTRACLTLTRRQHRALQGIARSTGIPAAETVRRALDAFLSGRVAGYVPAPLRPGPDTVEDGPAPTTID